GIIARHVRYEQRPRRAPRQAGGEPAALDARERDAPGIELADRGAGGELARREALEVGEREAGPQHLDETRGAARDEKERLDLFRQGLDPAHAPTPRRARAVVP